MCMFVPTRSDLHEDPSNMGFGELPGWEPAPMQEPPKLCLPHWNKTHFYHSGNSKGSRSPSSGEGQRPSTGTEDALRALIT